MFIGAFNREITSCFFSKPYIRISFTDGRILNSAHFLSSLSLFFVDSQLIWSPKRLFIEPWITSQLFQFRKADKCWISKESQMFCLLNWKLQIDFPTAESLSLPHQQLPACTAEQLHSLEAKMIRNTDCYSKYLFWHLLFHYTSNFTPFKHLSVILARFNASKVLDYGLFAIWLGKTYKSRSWQPRWWWKTAPI